MFLGRIHLLFEDQGHGVDPTITQLVPVEHVRLPHARPRYLWRRASPAHRSARSLLSSPTAMPPMNSARVVGPNLRRRHPAAGAAAWRPRRCPHGSRRSTMSEHQTATREEWQAARAELAKLEAEHAELDRKVTEARRQLPWVPVEKEYRFDTENGPKTLGELFDGRSQLLAYNIMFGPDYELGACPGCTNLGDELDAPALHLSHRDVTLICFSRAPIDRLIAYKERMGWQFPYVSTYETEFPFDFGLALTPQQAQAIPQVKEMIDNPPEWLAEWGRQVGAKLDDGLREGPSFIAFARDNGAVYHTYTVMAPDPFVAPYHSFLLERTPKPGADEPRAWRKDEYPH